MNGLQVKAHKQLTTWLLSWNWVTATDEAGCTKIDSVEIHNNLARITDVTVTDYM